MALARSVHAATTWMSSSRTVREATRTHLGKLSSLRGPKRSTDSFLQEHRCPELAKAAPARILGFAISNTVARGQRLRLRSLLLPEGARLDLILVRPGWQGLLGCDLGLRVPVCALGVCMQRVLLQASGLLAQGITVSGEAVQVILGRVGIQAVMRISPTASVASFFRLSGPLCTRGSHVHPVSDKIRCTHLHEACCPCGLTCSGLKPCHGFEALGCGKYTLWVPSTRMLCEKGTR